MCLQINKPFFSKVILFSLAISAWGGGGGGGALSNKGRYGCVASAKPRSGKISP